MNIGDKASFSKTITETDVYTFAGICGDFNPVHVNKLAAEESQFGKRICHGALVNSFISTVIGMYLPGNGAIYLEQNTRFVNPVFIGDTITASVEVDKIEQKSIGVVISLHTIVSNQNGELVIDGNATVLK